MCHVTQIGSITPLVQLSPRIIFPNDPSKLSNMSQTQVRCFQDTHNVCLAHKQLAGEKTRPSYLFHGFVGRNRSECGGQLADVHVHVAVLRACHRGVFLGNVFALFKLFAGLFHLQLCIPATLCHGNLYLRAFRAVAGGFSR